MSGRTNTGYFLAIAGGIALAVILFILGLRLEGRLGSIENRVLDRAPSAEPLQEIATGPRRVATGQTVYVPVYSHIYHQGGRVLPLETTLSIRNTDPDSSIVIQSVRYYDTGGRMIREYMQKPAVLAPLASADFLVERRDSAGGAGANFLVEWVSEELVQRPIIEAVMVSTEGSKAFSFSSEGKPIADARPAE